MLAERPLPPVLERWASLDSHLVRLSVEIDRIETAIAPLGRERLARTQRGRTQSRMAPSTAMSTRSLNSADLASPPRGDGSKLAFANGWLHKNRQDGLPLFEHRAAGIQRYYRVDLAEGW